MGLGQPSCRWFMPCSPCSVQQSWAGGNNVDGVVVRTRQREALLVSALRACAHAAHPSGSVAKMKIGLTNPSHFNSRVGRRLVVVRESS